ncbi:GNAT family N-acetyltransferase [Falsochrobactrum sp. TDYN1]|uniref:GNAT family N-acetyltransferase n=1 Tax=Falsochrobactrum tianjinense TaxID=2706015 RepID=A0A949PNJ4_9HYPH|nr:GNAT family N-acetyltransferase [Falsochrobactrum sp. TDYN1]MBV2143319.1 GNAT family N-acetyltransferase [Falsochrobactrum sp. TDYN1]
MSMNLTPPVKLGSEYADAAARLMRASFNDRLPSLANLHTPDEDTWFFRNRVFKECDVWGVFDTDTLTGIIAINQRWIEQLYVLPAYQKFGVGTSLLNIAKQAFTELSLWTFQINQQARTFYERHGFVEAELTDGSNNEEQEPDVRYFWQARNEHRVP